MTRKIVPSLIGIAGILNLFLAVNTISYLSAISPLLFILLGAILVYWLFVNMMVRRRAEMKSVMVIVLFIVVPIALAVIALGSTAFMDRMIITRQMVTTLGFTGAAGGLITIAIFTWNL